MAKTSSIAVIGAGLGGLSAAVRLAHKGYNVEVFEKSNTAGGKAACIYACGFRIDTGPSVLTMPFVLEDLFKDIEENINDYISIRRLDIICKYFYPDGTFINAYSDFDKLIEELSSKTGENKNNLKIYFDYCRNIYELTAELFLFSSPAETSTYININALKTLFSFHKIDSFRTMHEANSSFFSNRNIIQMFDRYATYNGSNPYYAPATLNIIPYVEYILGGYYIEQGICSLPAGIQKAANKKGVTFHFNSDVEAIIHDEGRVKGITVNGEFKGFETVITNSDVNHTYSRLLKDTTSYFARKYNKHEPSTSAIIFCWGIKGIHDFLEAHNILFSGNYENEFDCLFNKYVCPDDPTVYIHISSKYKAGDAPEGHENWFVMVNTPYNNGSQNWNNETLRLRKIIAKKIKRMLGIDVNLIIEYEKIITPEDIESSTNSFKGSIYGISSNNRFTAFMRQSNRSRKYKGLYFTGGSAHPGGGIPLVILSGKIVSRLIGERCNND